MNPVAAKNKNALSTLVIAECAVENHTPEKKPTVMVG